MDGLYEQLRIALHQTWRRRWLALGVAWGVCVLGWLAVALFPNSYESKAKVLVQMQSVLPSQSVINPADRQNDLNRIKQSLTSTANLEKVVRRTDLNSLVASDRDLAVQVAALRESIKVTAPINQDNLFEISATSGVAGFSNRKNARTAAAVVQNLIDLFVGDNLAGDREVTGQTLAFLDAQLRDREVKLQEAEQRRVDFEQRFLGLLPGEGSIGQRMSAARAELTGVEQQLITANGSLGALRGQLAGTPQNVDTGFGGANVAGPAGSQLAILEAQLGQAMARGWTDQHPDVAATRAQIERLRPIAARERAGGGGRYSASNPAYVQLRAMVAEKESQVAAAQMRKNQLQADMAQLGARQSSEPGVAAEQDRLNRNYDVLKRQYDKLLEDREQLRLKSDVQNSTNAIKFKVIDPASQPVVPASPNRPILLSVILIVALGAGVGAAFARGQIQTTFPTQNRLQQASGLPVLGAISQIVSPDQRLKARKHLLWLGGGAGGLFAGYAVLMLVEFWQRSTVA